jgi:hypothetical protein
MSEPSESYPMKYFTPQLFIRLQECADAAAFRTVNADWEDAVQQYQHHLQEIAPTLKGGLRRLVRRGSLHDSRVVDAGTTEQQLTILLQEEASPSLLSLTYSLVDAPVIDRAAIPEEHRSLQITARYRCCGCMTRSSAIPRWSTT